MDTYGSKVVHRKNSNKNGTKQWICAKSVKHLK